MLYQPATPQQWYVMILSVRQGFQGHITSPYLSVLFLNQWVVVVWGCVVVRNIIQEHPERMHGLFHHDKFITHFNIQIDLSRPGWRYIDIVRKIFSCHAIPACVGFTNMDWYIILHQ